MKTRFLGPLAVIFALAGATLPDATGAEVRNDAQLLRSVARELPRYAPDVDPATLSTGQLAALHVVLHSNRSHSEIRAQVRSIIGGLDVLLFGRNLTFQ